MLKKIIIEIEADKIVFYLFSRNKLVSKNSVIFNDIQEVKNILQQYSNLGFKKVYIILKNDISNYKVTEFTNTNKKQINYLAKLSIIKHFYVSEKDYYFDTCVLNKYKNTFKVLIVIVNKNKIDELVRILLEFNFEIKNINTYQVELLKCLKNKNIQYCIMQSNDYLYIMKFEKGILNNIMKLDIFDKSYLKNELSKIDNDSEIYFINEINNNIISIFENEKLIKKQLKLSSKGYVYN